ncbi:hypothetical protein KSS87_006171 [Heliosperma pusillum]|nr:hypothetical protein KSS87_006171 [Heliosperma pusillum]
MTYNPKDSFDFLKITPYYFVYLIQQFAK